MGREQEVYRRMTIWLEGNGAASGSTKDVIQNIKTFYATDICKGRERFSRIGVLGKLDKYAHKHLWLYLLWPEPFDETTEQARQMHELGSAFSKIVIAPAKPEIFPHLEFISPDDLDPDQFATELERSAEEEAAAFLGVIVKFNQIVYKNLHKKI